MAESFAWPDGKKMAVSISFDDARKSQPERAIPILNAHKTPATFYVLPLGVGEAQEDWAAAVKAGHEIGNHTVSHPCTANYAFSRENALEDYTLAQMEGELLRANDQIEVLLGVQPKTFAYPCGQTFVGRGTALESYIPLIAKHFLAGRGYPNELHNKPKVCDLARAHGLAFDAMPFPEIKKWIEQAKQDTGWTILAGHDVAEAYGHQTVQVDVLHELLEYLNDPKQEIWVDTVANIAQYVSDFQAKQGNPV